MDRDRDAAGRARNARPRDALGRPLPYGSAGVDRLPEGVVRSPDQSLTEAQRLLDVGRPFEAHEVLEDAWKNASEYAQLWQGLAQLAVGATHAARGNARGARSLLARGAANIAPFVPAPYGVDVPGLLRWATALSEALASGSELPSSPRLR